MEIAAKVRTLFAEKRGSASVLFFALTFSLMAIIVVVAEVGIIYEQYEYCQDVAENCVYMAMQGVLNRARTGDEADAETDLYLADGALFIPGTASASPAGYSGDNVAALAKQYISSELAKFQPQVIESSIKTTQKNKLSNTGDVVAGDAVVGGSSVSQYDADDVTAFEMKVLVFIPIPAGIVIDDTWSQNRTEQINGVSVLIPKNTIPMCVNVKEYAYRHENS